MPVINTGGPDFPIRFSEISVASDGMSLRDWFAGQALMGYLSAFAAEGDIIPADRVIAAAAYAFADAMLAVREVMPKATTATPTAPSRA